MNDLMTKSFLSYVNLKKEALKDEESGPDLEMGIAQIDTNLLLFLEEAETVNAEMESIQKILLSLQEANEQSKSIHKPEDLKSLRSRINSDITSVQKKAKIIKSKLEELDCGDKEGSPIYRTRISVTNGLRKKLKEMMMEFQSLRQTMMSEYRETVGRRYFTVTGSQADENTIEKIIESGGEELMTKTIMEHGRGELTDTVVEIRVRRNAAEEIERSLLELHQVFLDMAVLVEAQGEQMDDIEHQVVNAAHYVSVAGKDLNAAKNYQRSGRKWMCIAVIVLLALILALVVPIVVSLKNS